MCPSRTDSKGSLYSSYVRGGWESSSITPTGLSPSLCLPRILFPVVDMFVMLVTTLRVHSSRWGTGHLTCVFGLTLPATCLLLLILSIHDGPLKTETFPSVLIGFYQQIRLCLVPLTLHRSIYIYCSTPNLHRPDGRDNFECQHLSP